MRYSSCHVLVFLPCVTCPAMCYPSCHVLHIPCHGLPFLLGATLSYHVLPFLSWIALLAMWAGLGGVGGGGEMGFMCWGCVRGVGGMTSVIIIGVRKAQRFGARWAIGDRPCWCGWLGPCGVVHTNGHKAAAHTPHVHEICVRLDL